MGKSEVHMESLTSAIMVNTKGGCSRGAWPLLLGLKNPKPKRNTNPGLDSFSSLKANIRNHNIV